MYCKLKHIPGLVVDDTIGLFDTWTAMVPETGQPNVGRLMAAITKESEKYTVYIQAAGGRATNKAIGGFYSRDLAIEYALNYRHHWNAPPAPIPDYVHRY